MQIKAEIERLDLERLVSSALASEYPDMFPHGASIQWHVSGGTYVSVTASPRNPTQGKD